MKTVRSKLVALLKDKDPTVRYESVEALYMNMKKDPDAIKITIRKIIDFLGDECGFNRRRAIEILDDVGEYDYDLIKGSVANIITLLGDSDNYVREYAARALGKIGVKDTKAAKESVPGLIDLLQDQQAGVRVHAFESLTEIAKCNIEIARTSISKISSLLDDKSLIIDYSSYPDDWDKLELELCDIRFLAVQAMGILGECYPRLVRSAIPKIGVLLEDETELVADEALIALRKIARNNAVAVEKAFPSL